MKALGNSSGIALLITLLVVTLLTILIVEFTYSTNVDAHLTRNALSSLQARYLARAGLTLAEMTLKLDAVEKTTQPPARPNVETLLDPWAQPFPPRPLAGGVGQAGFRIVDESSRFNVNGLVLRPGINAVTFEARKTLFQGLLAALGLDINLLFPLVDWLDADDEVGSKSGAEAEYYQGLTPPYQPRNGRALSVDELALVRGFSELTREQWAVLRSALTVMPNEELVINVNTASELLLTALLTSVDSAATAKAIVSLREQQALTSAKQLDELAPGWTQLPAQVKSVFGFRSSHFTIHAVGIAAGVTRGLAVLERRNGQRLEVVDWRDEPGKVSLTSTEPSGGITLAPFVSR